MFSEISQRKINTDRFPSHMESKNKQMNKQNNRLTELRPVSSVISGELMLFFYKAHEVWALTSSTKDFHITEASIMDGQSGRRS